MINLLPPYYKKELKQRENQKIILINFFLFSIFLIYLILLLLIVRFYIENKINLVKLGFLLEEKKFQSQEIKNLKNKIDSSNKNISKINQFYKQKISLNETLEKIFKNIPEGVILNSFSFQKDGSQVIISGIAQTREDYLELQNNLKSNSDFFDFVFPIEAWTKKTNLDFNISFKIK